MQCAGLHPGCDPANNTHSLRDDRDEELFVTREQLTDNLLTDLDAKTSTYTARALSIDG